MSHRRQVALGAMPVVLLAFAWGLCMLVDKALDMKADRCFALCDVALLTHGIPKGSAQFADIERYCGPVWAAHPSCLWPDSMRQVCMQSVLEATHCLYEDACEPPIVHACDVVFPVTVWR